MKALILAAGYATRLYPLTKNFPKSLLKVKDKPIIDYILEKVLLVPGIDEIVVVTNSKFAVQFRKWARLQQAGKRISVLDDLTKSNETRRGAVGDIHFAIDKKRMKDDLLVIGGDNLFDGDLNKLISFAKKKNGPVIGVYDIKSKHEATKYGVIKLNRGKRIVEFREKPSKPQSTLVGMCLYYFPKQKLDLVKEYIKDKKGKRDATGFYIEWLRKKVDIYGYALSGKWYDIGDYKFYNQAKDVFGLKHRS
ncbi:MAG: nucleotidyltransferase family protein [Candidatus Omnitrophica bacterium]|nr:nucleotidyltransferase family protein [Candidatus Omnitrophota bacterium]MBU1868856.1 nucleotidyltransferase family protein [Candidatus Omnitrophota bacterium]